MTSATSASASVVKNLLSIRNATFKDIVCRLANPREIARRRSKNSKKTIIVASSTGASTGPSANQL